MQKTHLQSLQTQIMILINLLDPILQQLYFQRITIRLEQLLQMTVNVVKIIKFKYISRWEVI